MTCQLLVNVPDGSVVRARALLDSASSTSFVSERLALTLRLPRSSQNISISGIAGLSHDSPLHSIANFNVSPVSSPDEKFTVTAVIMPRVTCDLPLLPVLFNSKWTHLCNLHLTDPDFERPGTFSSAWISMLTHCCKAGRVAHQTHPLRLKPNLAGSLLEERVPTYLLTSMLHLTT